MEENTKVTCASVIADIMAQSHSSPTNVIKLLADTPDYENVVKEAVGIDDIYNFLLGTEYYRLTASTPANDTDLLLSTERSNTRLIHSLTEKLLAWPADIKISGREELF